MNPAKSALRDSVRVEFFDDLSAGLSARPKSIPSKYFYDERGSCLFDRICSTPEYYPTATERALLKDLGPGLSSRLGPGVRLVEPGGGSGAKARLLLDSLREPLSYVPVDVSREYLFSSAESLSLDYPNLKVHPLCADFMKPLNLDLEGIPGKRTLIFFPGSTIGNLTPPQAVEFLTRMGAWAGKRGLMLVGVDTKKAKAVLDRAYNDREGVTAAFNLNLLIRANKELGSDFDPEAFRHKAFYNCEEGRVEMHLVSQRGQTVRLGNRCFRFEANERVLTELSYKYAPQEFRGLALEAGWKPLELHQDPKGFFSVHLLGKA